MLPMPASARWSRSASAIERSARRRIAQPAQRLVGIEVGRQEVRSEAGERSVERLGALLQQLDDRGIEADRHRARDLEDEPSPRRRPPPALARPIAMPRPVHPQMRPDHKPVVEPDQEVLAERLDRGDLVPDDALDLGHGDPARRSLRAVTVRPTRYGRSPPRSGRACRLRALRTRVGRSPFRRRVPPVRAIRPTRRTRSHPGRARSAVASWMASPARRAKASATSSGSTTYRRIELEDVDGRPRQVERGDRSIVRHRRQPSSSSRRDEPGPYFDIGELGGREFVRVFLDFVEVPAPCLVGEVLLQDGRRSPKYAITRRGPRPWRSSIDPSYLTCGTSAQRMNGLVASVTRPCAASSSSRAERGSSRTSLATGRPCSVTVMVSPAFTRSR